MYEPRIIQQPPKRLNSNRAFAYVLVPVQLRSARGLCVIAMPHPDILQTDGSVELGQCFAKTLLGNNVISGNMRVAGVDASAHRNMPVQVLNDFRDLLEAAAQRELGPGGVFNQYGQSTFCEIKSLARGRYGRRRSQQAFFALRAAKRPRMENEVIRAQGQCPLDLSAKRFD